MHLLAVREQPGRFCRVAIVTAALTAACGGGPPEWEGAVRDSAGVRLVSNPATALWTDADRPTVAVDLRIPSEGAGGHYQLGDVVGIALRADRHLFVLDRLSREVQQFDGAGRWVRTVGRPGGGPGELGGGVDGVWLGPGDTLHVADVGAQRVVRFASDGTPVAGYPIPFARGIAYEWRTDGTGRVVHTLVLLGEGNSARRLVVARDPRGAVTDTLLELPEFDAMAMGPTGPVLTVFAPEPRWDVGADGALVSGITDAYRIRRYAPGGARTLEFTFPATTEQIGPADREFYRAAMIRLWEGRMPPQMHGALRQNVRFHESYPAFASLRAGPSGTTWVQRFRRAADYPPETRAAADAERDVGADTWDVFDDLGRYLGALTLPPRFTPLLFADHRVLGVQRDSLDLQSVIGVAVGSLSQHRPAR